jgi:hypothetical protein
MRAGKGSFFFGKLNLALKKISAGRRPVRAMRPMLLARRLFPETENTIITEEVKKFPDGK